MLEHEPGYWDEGEWDIIPEGVADKEEVLFDRHTLHDLVPPEFWRARIIWQSYRDGFLMYSGGRMEQPLNHMLIISQFNLVYSKWVEYKRKMNNGRR